MKKTIFAALIGLFMATTAFAAELEITNPYGGTVAVRGPFTDLDGVSDGGATLNTGYPNDACLEILKVMGRDPNTLEVRVNGVKTSPASHCTNPGYGKKGGNAILQIFKPKGRN